MDNLKDGPTARGEVWKPVSAVADVSVLMGYARYARLLLLIVGV